MLVQFLMNNQKSIGEVRMEYYNYNQTLDEFEKFMIETGIRKYCSELCRGSCCDIHKCNDCFKYGERRLFCSTYICPELEAVLRKTDARGFKIFQKLRNYIIDVGYDKLGTNPYFVRITNNTMKMFNFEKIKIDKLTTINSYDWRGIFITLRSLGNRIEETKKKKFEEVS